MNGVRGPSPASLPILCSVIRPKSQNEFGGSSGGDRGNRANAPCPTQFVLRLAGAAAMTSCLRHSPGPFQNEISTGARAARHRVDPIRLTSETPKEETEKTGGGRLNVTIQSRPRFEFVLR
ncbi:hypothetical protein GWI33_000261 [Rhynchophorus ferrugineus]|uniref:Uncharacterized protein n=1 Tax=Rhynchophorus ferrugineus TaxID=354439 RepID=A0A834IVB5_RHYFE|nr:hypothetical protein GWI33_000261 [Rhynchophorus ferrugineus]